MEKIYKNGVYQYVDEEFRRIRVIWLDEKGLYCFYVSLEGDTAMPQVIAVDELTKSIENNVLVKIPEPYDFTKGDLQISEAQRNVRDNAWKIVNFLWNENENRIEILYKQSRSKVINSAITELNNTNEKEVRRIMTRFWQRGMVKNSLLPDYSNSGGKGMARKENTDLNGDIIKRGRPTNPNINGIVNKHLSVNSDIKKIIDLAIIRFYKNKKMSIAESYKHMLQKFFSNKIMVNGKEVYEVWDTTRTPSYDEFYYWLKKMENESKKKFYVSRNSLKEFELKHRELMGSATSDSFGPGYRYEIDATIINVYLVSKVNRSKIIGRAVMYSVIDTWNRFVAGMYVGLDGPSWIGAMMALDNVVEDKVSFCKKYGVEITHEMWPNTYLPEMIRADRGEFEGYNVEKLVNNLGISIENTPPYRGDLKGIIERSFRTTKGRLRHLVPGVIQKEYRKRGDKDYRLDAVLDIDELTEVLILNVIRHNNSIIKGYPREKGLIVDDVPPIPVEMLKWGMENKICGYRIKDREIIRLNLLPSDIGTLTRYGIRYKNLYYSCEEAIDSGWFIDPHNEKVNITYDPRNMNYIYISTNQGKDCMKCFLTKKCSTFKDLSLDEIIFLQELDKAIIEEKKDNQNQIDINFITETQRVVEKAKEKTKIYVKGSDNSRIKSIRSNRAEEKKNNKKCFILEDNDDICANETKSNIEKDSYEDNTFESGVMLNILKEGDVYKNEK